MRVDKGGQCGVAPHFEAIEDWRGFALAEIGRGLTKEECMAECVLLVCWNEYAQVVSSCYLLLLFVYMQCCRYQR
jgi:hypothetical protein